jgi:hypothetical protein
MFGRQEHSRLDILMALMPDVKIAKRLVRIIPSYKVFNNHHLMALLTTNKLCHNIAG